MIRLVYVSEVRLYDPLSALLRGTNGFMIRLAYVFAKVYRSM
jgi:hypothetical protein